MSRLELAIAEFAAALLEEIAASEPPADPKAPELLSVEEAARLAGIGRTHLYRLLGEGKVRSVVSGRRRLVPRSAIRELAEAAR